MLLKCNSCHASDLRYSNSEIGKQQQKENNRVHNAANNAVNNAANNAANNALTAKRKREDVVAASKSVLSRRLLEPRTDVDLHFICDHMLNWNK